MLALVSPLKIITAVAVAYAGLCLVIFVGLQQCDPSIKPAVLARIVLSAAFVLDLALCVAVHFLWRKIWAWLPVLNTMLFPDLNGMWRMTIHWSGSPQGGKTSAGVIEAVAKIKQSFLHMSMEVESKDSDSETLIAMPRKDPESGRPLVYYVFRVIPKKTSTQAVPSYEGAAILRFEAEPSARLRGNYFTSRMTQGYFTLDHV